MFFKQYVIQTTDHFNPVQFPEITQDLADIRTLIKKNPGSFRAEMLLSFAKNHCIRLDWIKSNPEFAELISSKTLPVLNFETLFQCSTKNPVFQQELEQYVMASLK